MEVQLGSIDLRQSHNLVLFLLGDVLVVLLNLLVVLLILGSGRFRKSTKHVLIVNLAVADLVVGVVVLPFYAYYGTSEGDWQSTCAWVNSLRLLQINLLPSITTLCVFVINLDYVFRMGCYFYTNGKTKYAMSGALGLIPWVFSAALLVPLYFVSTAPGLPYDQYPCFRRYKEDITALLHIFFSFFPQSFVIMVTGIAAVIGYLMKRRSTGLDMFGERMHSPVDIGMASFVTILFYTPYFCLNVPVNMISCLSTAECDIVRSIEVIASWLYIAKSIVVPLCWFCAKDFRAAFRNICCCCC